ncbi:PREDICTED: xylulose kinase isoform X4 [Rhagoletis zephyria]|uniref:xylulose kinase isoform X4 n=1 Tax=Rhagoletis zephyria TaxID=28612 RepID=UPI00081143B4|nr:PREDICTED: xylulose kinase isoform X4 [Rhagoletis zephyria]
MKPAVLPDFSLLLAGRVMCFFLCLPFLILFQLKAVQLSSNLEVIAIAEVKFDSDLPEFRTSGGANSSSTKHEVFVQPVMWVKAIDIVLDRLVMQGADLSTVLAIGGSAQQHGSLYWSRHGVKTLRNLNSDKFLHVQIDDSAFTVNRTPIWMDGSTEKQCVEMETAIGGRAEMLNISGSKCYARFTGPQIRKIYQERSNAYEETQRISLVSSFCASVFLGDIAPIDYGDASGMNLFDIKAKIWSKQCLNACAPDLEDRLGKPVPTSAIIGKICNFFVERFGFSPECIVTAFTGDNLSALSGMVLEQNCLVMSLGTSDTLIMNLKEQPRLEEGHVLCHPTEIGHFVGLMCFRNGSLVRDLFNKIEASSDWNKFNELLDSTPRGNYGNMALHFHSIEIIPNVKGVLRWTRNNSSENSETAKGVQKVPDVYQCQLCCRFHALQACACFRKMSVAERIEAVRVHKYCPTVWPAPTPPERARPKTAAAFVKWATTLCFTALQINAP